GFFTASLFWWLVAKVRPLWQEIRQNWQEKQQASQAQRTSGVEEQLRRAMLRKAQGMHLAAALFSLEEILIEPRLLAPPPTILPDEILPTEDAVTQTLPYLPAWPEIAAVYNAPQLTLPQALAGGSNLVIIGRPGSGKTVVLAHLASLVANRSAELGELANAMPFLIHVAELKLPLTGQQDVLEPIRESIAGVFSALEQGRLASLTQTAFENGRALLLLDGFDELPPAEQENITAYLQALLKAYPRARIVTTGTPEYVDGLIQSGFAPLALVAWNRRQIAAFLHQWGVQWNRFVANEAWMQSTTETIDPLLLNSWLSEDAFGLTPLELTLKVWGAYAGDLIGPQPSQAIGTHIRRLAPANTPPAAMETLAMQVVMAAQPVFDPRRAKEWVKTFEPVEEPTPEETPDAEASAASTAKKGSPKSAPTPTPGLVGKMSNSGLLLSYPHNKMRFLHPVFLGYLAGRALSGYNPSTLLEQSDWVGKTLSLHYLAVHGDATPIVEKMLEWSRLPMHRPLLTVARWLRDSRRDAPWRNKVMAALLKLLQSDGLPLALRGQAMAAFALSNDPGVPALFRQLLNSLSFELVQLCALGSGALQDTKAIPSLTKIITAPSLSAQRAACLALVAIGTPEALEVVAHILLNGDEELRRAAAEALANDPSEGYAMLQDGTSLEDILARRAVVYGLRRVEEPWASEILQKMQIEDDQWVVRNAASEALENKAHPAAAAPRPLKAPSETPWLIAFAGKQGVGISPGAPATDILITALKKGSEEEKLAALPYLKYTPSEGVIRALYETMYTEDPKLREMAFLTLWEIGASGVQLSHPSQYGFS
ncbi:MAG: HEAT repeat domain-containing protein, partial [Anaerolineae bacterium]